MTAANDNTRRLATLKQSAARITSAARDPQNVKKFGRMGAANLAAGEAVWEIFRQRQRQQQVEAGK